jgi:hypothetical protein
MKTDKDLLMYFHTSFRNVGLYTSMSFAALGYSRFYRDKNELYNIYLIISSLIFISSSLYVCFNLSRDISHYQKEVEGERIKNFTPLPYVIGFVNTGILVLGILTLKTQVGKLGQTK